MISALYVDRESLVHRLAPGTKLLALPVFGTLLFSTGSLAFVAAGLFAVLALYGLAKIPASTLLMQMRSAALLLGVFFLAQLWLGGWILASVTVMRFLALILLGSLVTLTTRASVMIATLERALSTLAFLGVDAAKVSLAISLVLRFVPVIQTVLSEVREAQAARGRDGNLFSLGVPVLVRTLKMADEIAEAIDARS